MILHADHILTVSGAVLSPGAVRVKEERITAVGARDQLTPENGEEVIPLDGSVLAPGLINAHCHLDYTEFRGVISPPENFTDWIKDINALKRDFSNNDYIRSVKKGFRLLMENGTTTVANIESFPEILPFLDPPPIRTWWFLELIDVRQRLHDEASLLGTLSFFQKNPDWLGGFGLSPHAPYTASIELYRLAKYCSEHYQMPLTTHVAESLHEQEMFMNGRGQLFELMQSLGRDCTDCGHGSPLSHLLEHDVLSENCLAVHLNYLQPYDYKTLAASGMNLVYCPKSRLYFNHRLFELERLLALGLNISIGTDSLASNNSLNLRSELRQAAQLHPKVSREEWVKMITVNPARALGQSGQLGEIKAGALADLVAFPMNGYSDPYEALIESRTPPSFLMVNGRKVGI